ncbi:sulfotransferase [Frankia gtarii]|uniref:sulfotransferase n=1 Tax=Frankia gtarii TaxID=2950102 RepID=UPI0021C1948C|nr:sulfotransferase [Frankia gtarii]
MALPDFFVIGAPDAGMEILLAGLRRCPAVFLPATVLTPPTVLPPPTVLGSPVVLGPPGGCGSGVAPDGGEPAEGSAGPWGLDAPRRRAWFEALVDPAPAGVLRGVSAPYHLADFTALRQLHELLPYARLIALLRDPAARAHTHWLRMRASGLEPIADFEGALAVEGERARTASSWPWRYAALGRYGAQVQRLYTLFAGHQVLLMPYSELDADPAAALGRVHRFLGLGRGRGRHRGAAGTGRADLAGEVPVRRCGDPAGLRCVDPGAAVAARRLDPATAARLHADFHADLALLDRVTRRRWALGPVPE